jgi:hypothetical protein
MFKALERELNDAWDKHGGDVLWYVLSAVHTANREADALAACDASAPSNEGAGVAGASVSHDMEVINAVRWLERVAKGSSLWGYELVEKRASVILAELERLRAKK